MPRCATLMADGDLVGIVGFVAAALSLSASFIVFRASRGAPANRRLAFVLLLEGQFVGAIGVMLLFYEVGPDDTGPSLPFLAVSLAATVIPWFYLLFLGVLRTPLVRPFAGPLAPWWLLAAATAALLARIWITVAEFPNQMLVATFVTAVPYALVSLFALVASVSTYVRAPRKSLVRRQARAYVVAFGVRDALFGLFFALIFLEQVGLLAGTTPWRGGRFLIPPLILLVYIPLVAYGAVKWQLFDLDLRIKVTIRRGTVFAVLLGAFAVFTVMAENFLTDRYGWVWGGLAAGLLLFALSPLQRLGARVADSAFPRVADTPAYRRFRAMEIYKAAVEELLPDGITPKERRALERLRGKLGVGPADASLIERDASVAG